MKTEIAVQVNERSLEAEIGSLLDLEGKLSSLGVVSAVTHRGEHYARDIDHDVTIVAKQDVLIKRSKATLTVVIAQPGASKDEVLADMGSFTQELRGAMVGRSQSWVSENSKTE